MEVRFTAEIGVWREGYVWTDLLRPSVVGDSPTRIPFDALVVANAPPSKECWRLTNTHTRYYDAELHERYFRSYNPFDIPGLFMLFGELEPTREAIKAFADKYGLLHYWTYGLDALEHPSAHAKNNQLFWEKEIQQMREMVEAWQSGSKAGAEYVRKSIDTIGMRPGLQARCSPQGIPYFECIPSSLLHALRLQLLQAISDSLEFLRCGWCGMPFEKSPVRLGRDRRGRSDKLFCSDSCRVKAYLRRRETAVKLRNEGRKLREIAKEVKTDLGTLKKWLGEDK